MRKLLAGSPIGNEIPRARKWARQMCKKKYVDGASKRHRAESYN